MKNGLYVVHRNVDYNQSAEELTEIMQVFAGMDLRERIAMRFHAQELAEHFDWKQLSEHYHKAHLLALSRM